MASPKKRYVKTNFQKQPIQGVVIDPLASAPSSPVEGQLYYDTVTKKEYVYNGTAWVALTGGQVDSIAAASNKITINNTDPVNPTIDVAIANLIDNTQSTSTNIYSASKVDSQITTAVVGFLKYQGVIDCSTNPNYPAASSGHVYRISVAGKIGGASGINVEIGDILECIADNAGGTEASVGSSFVITQGNLDGAVISSETTTVDGDIAVYSGTSGKQIKKVSASTFKTGLSLVKADVGLGNVDNTADADKPVSTATQTALDLKASLASPTLTGTPEAPTPTTGDSTTKIATTAFVSATLAATKYAADFADTDFSSGDLTITAAAHGLGATKDLLVIVLDSSSIVVNDGVQITMNTNGNVMVSVETGLEFSGRIIIKS